MALCTFRYTTLEVVKALLSTAVTDEFDDAAIAGVIVTASEMVNTWTRQTFQPCPDVVHVNGGEDPIVSHPDLLPVVDLRQIALVENRSFGAFREMDRIIPGMRNWMEDYPIGYQSAVREPGWAFLPLDGSSYGQAAWERDARYVRLLARTGGFITGFRNIEMAGWWGWVAGKKKACTTLATALIGLTAATTVHVVDLVDVDTGDILEVGDTVALTVVVGPQVPKKVLLLVVTAIAANIGSGYDLTVDEFTPPITLPIGASVCTYGSVPKGIQDVTTALAQRIIIENYAKLTGDDLTLAQLEDRLVSERTDNYSYTLRSSGVGDSGAANGRTYIGRLTGSVRLDTILREFQQPTIYVGVV